jgi:lipopolysaccharide transport system ATP-binding protein
LIDGAIRDEGNSSKVVDAYLAHLFGQQVVTNEPDTGKIVKKINREKTSNFQMEKVIPNIDRRLGDQKCRIIGVGLYDESMNRISSTLNDKIVVLRLTIQNHSLGPGVELRAGHIFRNSKGQEIASTNNLTEGQSLELPPTGGYVTISMKILLPRMYPGSYAFSVTVAYVKKNGEVIMADRIENAIVFDVLSEREIYVMMSFHTIFEYELEI